MPLTRPKAHQLQDSDFKQSVRLLSASNVSLSGGAPATLDGASLALGDRILVTGQTTGSQNGLYKVSVVGSGSNGTWIRTRDGDDTGDITAGMITYIESGTTYADKTYKLTTDNPITIGSTALTFEEQASAAVGGSDTQVQFNDGGDLGGDAGLTYDKSTDALSVGGKINITNTALTDSMTLTTTEDSSTAGPVLTLKRNSSSPADNDYLGQVKFLGENDADQEITYAKITGKIFDASDGSEDGIIEFMNKKGGSNTITARLRYDSLQLLNDTQLSVNGDSTFEGSVDISDADKQFTHGDTGYKNKRYVLYGTTTDGTATEILVGGTADSRVSIPTNTTVYYTADIVARRTDATGESGAWHIKGVADNFSGTVADVGNVYEVVVAQDDTNWAVDIIADDTDNAVNVVCTGASSKTIKWVAVVNTMEVTT